MDEHGPGFSNPLSSVEEILHVDFERSSLHFISILGEEAEGAMTTNAQRNSCICANINLVELTPSAGPISSTFEASGSARMIILTFFVHCGPGAITWYFRVPAGGTTANRSSLHRHEESFAIVGQTGSSHRHLHEIREK